MLDSCADVARRHRSEGASYSVAVRVRSLSLSSSARARNEDEAQQGCPASGRVVSAETVGWDTWPGEAVRIWPGVGVRWPRGPGGSQWAT